MNVIISKNIKNKSKTRLYESQSILSLHKIRNYQPIIMGKYKKNHSILTILITGLFVIILGVLISGWYLNIKNVPQGQVLGVQEVSELIIDSK